MGARGALFSWILNYVGLIPTGIFTFIFSLVLFRRSGKEYAILINSSLVAATGIARFIAGVFPCDAGCTPIITLTGRLHAISGMLALFAGAIAPLLMALGLKREKSQPMFMISLILGIASLILFLLLASGLLQQFFGGIQRVLLILTYSWIILVSVDIRNGKF